MFNLVVANESVRTAHWSLDLLSHLDWNRFQELTARLLHRAGYLPEVAWIRPDGAVALTLVHPHRPGQLEAIVQCAPWHQRDIDAGPLQDLHQVVVDEGAQRGIFVTSGIFHETARAYAHLKPLELVDGSDLLRSLQRMTDEERAYFLRLTTMGTYMFPTCPSCAQTMELIDDSAAAQGRQGRDVVYKDRHFEGEEIDCKTLTLKKSAEVVFLKSVTARAMSVAGKATGNFVINGRLHIAAGGCVSGLVSARAIQLDPGGTLEADARILNEAELAHIRPMPVMQIWRCPAWPKCRATLPVR
jgi:hypothetical protein